MAGMLYYPFANAPLPILHQAVLYWDDLATVVAPGWEERLSPRMREAADAGLYRPIEAEVAYEPYSVYQLESELNDALALVPLDDLLPPAVARDEDLSTLHVGKLHHGLADELQRRGLVYPHPYAPDRLVAAQALIHIVVSLIAGRIAVETNRVSGCTGVEGLRPHTDLVSAYRLGTQPVSGYDVSSCWEVNIGSLLPVPRGDVMLQDLIDFRNTYNGERLRLMLAIDDLLHQLRQAGRHPLDAYRLVEKELSESAADWHAAIRGSRRHWVVRHLAATVAMGAALLGEPTAFGAALEVTGSAAVNVATGQMRDSRTGRLGGPAAYTYLHRARQFVASVDA